MLVPLILMEADHAVQSKSKVVSPFVCIIRCVRTTQLLTPTVLLGNVNLLMLRATSQFQPRVTHLALEESPSRIKFLGNERSAIFCSIKNPFYAASHSDSCVGGRHSTRQLCQSGCLSATNGPIQLCAEESMWARF